MHGKLVQIEADRMSAIEKQLNESQLKQLRDNRQNPSQTDQVTQADSTQSR